jgi:CRP-like cAMP-binding protein
MKESACKVKIGEYGTVRCYPAGTLLQRQGETATDVYLIHDGWIKLVRSNHAGRETIVGLRWSGCFIGTSSVIAVQPNPATVLTLDSSIVEQIPRDRFVEQLHSNPGLGRQVHEALSRENLAQMRELGEIACDDAKERFKNFIQRTIQSFSSKVCLPDGRLRLPLKKQEIAALLSISPVHLSRILNELADEGWIASNKQWIVVRTFPPSADDVLSSSTSCLNAS